MLVWCSTHHDAQLEISHELNSAVIIPRRVHLGGWMVIVSKSSSYALPCFTILRIWFQPTHPRPCCSRSPRSVVRGECGWGAASSRLATTHQTEDLADTSIHVAWNCPEVEFFWPTPNWFLPTFHAAVSKVKGVSSKRSNLAFSHPGLIIRGVEQFQAVHLPISRAEQFTHKTAKPWRTSDHERSPGRPCT